MEQVICIFGDSIAWGAGDPEKGGWVARLRNYFETNGFEIELYNCGVSGDTTDDLLQRFKTEALARKPDIIIFAVGINDSQYVRSKNNPQIPVKKFQSNLKTLINQAKRIANKIIFVGLTKVDESKTMPIPWNSIKYYDEENVRLYDTKIKEICGENNLHFINMLDLLDKSDLADGLHPNAKGHKKMFLRVKEFLISHKLVS